MKRTGCKTGKVRFPSAERAERALRTIAENPDPARLFAPNGYLYCSQCRGHHLTSSWTRPPRRSRGRGHHRKVRTL
jgi:hypothetical protein